MFFACMCALLVAMVLVLARGILGPTIYDRILAVNAFGTKTVLVIALYGYVVDRTDFLDIALVYALINFISTIAVLKFFEHGSLGQFRQRHKGHDT